MKIFNIDAQVKNVDLSKLIPYTLWHSHYIYFNRGAGLEHYQLLAHLASQCDDGETIYDIGTFVGYSALSLAHNPNVNVVTYDLIDHFKTSGLSARNYPNITFKIADCTTPSEAEAIAKSPLVFLDVDPHDGIQEPHIFKSLEETGFKGILVLDDIHLNEGMRNFWNWIPEKYKKYDISKYGHHSGTGLVVFDESHANIVFE